MKPNRFERSYRDTTPLKDVVAKHFSALTPIARSSGKIGLNCDFCGLPFETYSCWAKRTAHHYCGRACSSAAKEKKEQVNCVICGASFEIIPSLAAGRLRKVTCSVACSRKKKSAFLLGEASNMYASAIFNFGHHEWGEKISKKLTNDMVSKIRLDNRSQMRIAKDFGISQSAVSQIKSGVVWRKLSTEESSVNS
jgi:hypothetical protein